MSRLFRKMSLIFSILVLLLFLVFVINQTVQIVDLASRFDPGFGRAVFWLLMVVYAGVVAIPVFLFFRLPRSLKIPSSEDSIEFPSYLEALKKRLAVNPRVKGLPLSTRQEVEGALALLGKQADGLVKQTASRIFITTAISQSGRLDAFMVLAAQVRLLWQLAHLFYQRPALGDLLRLYANVAATVFLASELEDLDVHEQISVISSNALGSAALAVPGTSLLINSVLNGTGNAFLTLRVGMIAKRSCGVLYVAERRSLRRAATVEALNLLGGVISHGVRKISRAIIKGSKAKMVSTVSGAAGQVKEAGQAALSRVRRWGKRRPVGDKPSAGDKGPGGVGSLEEQG